MRRLALLSFPLALLLLALGGGLSSQATGPTPSPSPTADTSPTATEEPTPSPSPVITLDPITTPVPSPNMPPAYTGSLKPGDWVQVTGTGSCLNARSEPRLTPYFEGADPNATILNCLPDGFVGRLSTDVLFEGKAGAPVQVDGHWWWHMFAQGG